MNRTIATILLTLFAIIGSKGQKMTLQHIFNIDKSIETFSGDAFGNVYIFLTEGNIIKIDSTDKIISSAENKIIGNEISIDSKNPYKIIIFSEDEQTATLFDNEFSPNGKIEFKDIDISQVILCCAASDNGFWAMEENRHDITKFSFDLEKIISISGSELFDEPNFDPTHFQETGEYLFVWQKNSSAYIFDKYGNKINKLPFAANSYSAEYPYIFYTKNGEIFVYNIIKHTENKIDLGTIKAETIDVHNNHFFIKFDKKIYHYFLK